MSLLIWLAINCPNPAHLGQYTLNLSQLNYYHERCRMIYGHPNYCVKWYSIKMYPEGGKHINIICGVGSPQEITQ